LKPTQLSPISNSKSIVRYTPAYPKIKRREGRGNVGTWSVGRVSRCGGVRSIEASTNSTSSSSVHVDCGEKNIPLLNYLRRLSGESVKKNERGAAEG
jgi:hypothetical protein